jgi:hypothetical protein
MSTLAPAPDGQRVTTDPSAASLAHWAYEKHTEDCATCRRGDTWCETGRRYLAATRPANDLPGYPEL